MTAIEKLNKMTAELNVKKAELWKIAGTSAGAEKIMNDYLAQFGEKALHIMDAIEGVAKVAVFS